MCKKLIKYVLFLVCALYSGSALALNLQISSGAVSTDGLTAVLTMNDSSLSGSTAGCFTFSGNIGGGIASPSSPQTPVSATLSGGNQITVVSKYPLVQDNATSIVMSAFPTCAITGATQGVSAGQTASLTTASEYWLAGSAHWSSVVQYQGSPALATDGNGYPLTAAWNSPNGSFDFSVTGMGGKICVWSLQLNNAFTLYEDGAIVLRQKLSAGATYGETCWTGLDTGAHTWSISNSSTTASYANASIAAVRVQTPTFGTKPAALGLMVGCGASIMNLTGGGSSPDNGDTTQLGLLRTASGVVIQGESFSGQTLYTTLRDACPAGMVPAGGATPFLGWMEPDPNDLTSATSAANEQAATQTVITNIMANAHPPTKLIVLGIFATTLNANSSTCNSLTVYQCTTLYNNAIIAGIAAAANANVVFVHTNQLASGAPDWYDYTSVHSPCDSSHDTSDGIHPCGATSLSGIGYGKISNREAPIVAGYLSGQSFTISGGAAGGLIGQPSSAFTATLGGTGSFWVDPVTVNSSGSSDTVCIVAGSCGTGSVTLPVSYGSHTFQFTIQPSSAGSRTISYTNLADAWVAPSSNTYTGMVSLGSAQTGGVNVTGGARIQ